MNCEKNFKAVCKRVRHLNIVVRILIKAEISMKTDEKTSLPRLRVAVMGSENVGKSALTVRYLTRRFIGEYRSNTDLLYRQTVTVSNAAQEIEICDVACEPCDSSGAPNDQHQLQIPDEPLQWADACVVTYSVTERRSLTYAAAVLERLRHVRQMAPPPVALVANKADLEHIRVVDELEGRTLAVQHNCQFYEVSVAENSSNLYQVFDNLIVECRAIQSTQKTRKFSVSKMIGTLIGNGKTPQNLPQGGTVVACQKSDLYKSRVLKRRQNFTATASL